MKNYREPLDALIDRSQLLVERLGRMDCTGSYRSNEKLVEIALDGEIIALNLRKLLIEASVISKEELHHKICIMNGYSVHKIGDTTIVRMPPLALKERAYKKFSYFLNPLYGCLDEYAKQNEIEKYDRCVLKIKHIFPRETPLRQLHDFDNLEVKKVIDAIALYFLIDDNVTKCQVHHVGEYGDKFETEVWILPLVDGDKKAEKS